MNGTEHSRHFTLKNKCWNTKESRNWNRNSLSITNCSRNLWTEKLRTIRYRSIIELTSYSTFTEDVVIHNICIFQRIQVLLEIEWNITTLVFLNNQTFHLVHFTFNILLWYMSEFNNCRILIVMFQTILNQMLKMIRLTLYDFKYYSSYLSAFSYRKLDSILAIFTLSTAALQI